MSPSPSPASPPPAKTVELPGYGADPVMHQLASFSQDQWVTLKAQVDSMQCDKAATEEAVKLLLCQPLLLLRVLSPTTDVAMVSLPLTTQAPLFFSKEAEPSPPPPSQPSLCKQGRVNTGLPMATKIPCSMELQDVAAKAHKKVTLKLLLLPTPVLTLPTVSPLPPSSVPVVVSIPEANSVPEAKPACKEWAKGPLSSESPPCATCLYQHQECMKHQSQTDELDHQKLTVSPPSPEKVSNILHLPTCATCTKKGIPHCLCSKPVLLAQYQAEMLWTASISSFSSLHTQMHNIHVSWSQIQGQELLLQMAIVSHHSQAYHSNDPNCWVNSGLVVSREDVRQLFKAARWTRLLLPVDFTELKVEWFSSAVLLAMKLHPSGQFSPSWPPLWTIARKLNL
ncbi:hypothetical protein P691DRAFT_783460 [Macrolepiota fuliginosa MF-IS2]|uniref:Uncharacterized protein n=1 Tax=Macrolepiota fuliginosa MF-IS2 TaxID=1400762 RepID=A0A9P5WW99_9AGAR|nr:hypothetical protein P691DRAFT_783460 [Macrolepiota fuliginosa MF-IS2]